MRAAMLKASILATTLVLGAATPVAADPSFVLAAYGPAGLGENAASDLFAGYEAAKAPGLDSARAIALSPVAERELVTPYGVETSSSEPFYTAPLNEFAGQRTRFEPGVVGEALGKAKRAFLDSFKRK